MSLPPFMYHSNGKPWELAYNRRISTQAIIANNATTNPYKIIEKNKGITFFGFTSSISTSE